MTTQLEQLAIYEGAPTRTQPFPPWPHFWEADKQAVCDVLDSGKVNYWTGKKGWAFQSAFAADCGVKHAVAVSNGTAALHVALAAAGVGPGDEVIVPSYTFIATAMSVLHQTGVPVFADVDPLTGNLSPESARKQITDRTRAIIAVHLYGHPADMDGLRALADEHNLILIEDAAQAVGGEYNGRKVGALGHLAAFSFCQEKIFTTGGEGGMVTTDDDRMVEIARSVKDHGFNEAERWEMKSRGDLNLYFHYSLGYNYRMTEMQAAIGIEHLKHLDWNIDRRRENAHYLTERLRELPGITPPHEADHVRHAFYQYVFTIDTARFTLDRETFVCALKAEGIPAGLGNSPENYLEEVFTRHRGFGQTAFPFASPMNARTIDYSDVRCPVAADIGARSIKLKVHPTATLDDMADVADAVEKVARACQR